RVRVTGALRAPSRRPSASGGGARNTERRRGSRIDAEGGGCYLHIPPHWLDTPPQAGSNSALALRRSRRREGEVPRLAAPVSLKHSPSDAAGRDGSARDTLRVGAR